MSRVGHVTRGRTSSHCGSLSIVTEQALLILSLTVASITPAEDALIVASRQSETYTYWLSASLSSRRDIPATEGGGKGDVSQRGNHREVGNGAIELPFE